MKYSLGQGLDPLKKKRTGTIKMRESGEDRGKRKQRQREWARPGDTYLAGACNLGSGNKAVTGDASPGTVS